LWFRSNPAHDGPGESTNARDHKLDRGTTARPRGPGGNDPLELVKALDELLGSAAIVADVGWERRAAAGARGHGKGLL
jgi:hypothetical protein